jgi:hypothetical protein
MRQRIRNILFEAMSFQDRPNINDAFWAWFGKSKVVDEHGDPLVCYHGSSRTDRIESRFLKSRATSGPMSFFTNDPEIASNYSLQKQDTSLEYDEDYNKWFLYYPHGKKRGVYLGDAWYLMSQEQKMKLTQILPYVYQDEDDWDKFFIGDNMSFNESTWKYQMRKHGNNVLKAAIYIWLESGTLYNKEKDFLKVLAMAGLNNVKMVDQNEKFPGVYPVYISIQDPFLTSNISQSVIDAIEKSSTRRKEPSDGFGSDMWDKNYQNPRDWAQKLKEKDDLIWTSIPDWVTSILKKQFGYDGIIDSGGKHGGKGHTVFIPFESHQIKSIFNQGTWSSSSKHIMK